MRKNRLIEQDRCYHLTNRLAHRVFFLDDEEKDRVVALMRRVEEFSGVIVLAYAFLSNHFRIFIHVPNEWEIGKAEIMRRVHFLRRYMAPLMEKGACRENRSDQPAVALAGVQAGMNYCINHRVSISSDPFPFS